MERVQRVMAAILDPLDRRIIEGCFERCESLRSVADQLGLTYDVVRARFHSALSRLEAELSDER